MALSLEEFLDIVTSKCSICGMTPDQTLVVKRADDKHILHHHFIHNGETVCRMCRALAKDYGIKIILRHAARIMAKRMHDKRRKYKMKAQLEDMIDNWVK